MGSALKSKIIVEAIETIIKYLEKEGGEVTLILAANLESRMTSYSK